MGWMRYIAVALVNAFGAVVGIILMPFPQTTLAQSVFETEDPELRLEAPDLNLHKNSDQKSHPPSGSIPDTINFSSPTFLTLETSYPPAQSLTELYQLRDRLKVDREKLAQTPIPDSPTATWQADLQQQQSSTLKETLRQTEARISIEEKANRTWQTAAQMANQAVLAGDQNVAEWDKAKRLWLEAIATLRQIPADSFQAQNAIEKIIEYQGNLGIVAYQQAVAQQAAAQQSQPELPAPVEPQTIAPQVPGFELYGDSNRDGVVNETDNRQPQRWSLATGPLMLFNSDDDDRDQLPDWRDQIINGQADAEDLAPIHFKLAESYVGTEVFISVDEKSQDKVNLFQKTSNGWKPVDLTGQVPLVFSRDIILGIEARQFADGQWDGLATLTARARRQGQDVATTALQLGVAPWIMSPSTAPVSELHISDRGANQALVSQVQSAVVAPESRIKVTSGGTAWMQEAAEIGYVQFPAANSASNSGPKQPKHFPMILEGQPAEAKTSESYAESLLGKEQGWFEVGQDHQSNPLNPTLDSHSNLGVTPPLPDFPLGRIYYGKADGETLNPEIVEFLKAQNVQGPPVEIDTSWLLMRHVDELISFVPSQTGEPLMLVASPADGVQLLEELASRGYGGLELNRELSTQTTIQAALNNQLLLQHNLKLQRQNIDPLVKQLKREFRLKDEQIIRVPLLFGYSGYAWWPNLVNAIYVNRKLLASNPRGPLIDGRDYLQEDFRRRLAIAGLDITFLDDQYYQELKGDLHMGTNTIRQPIEQPFWEILPASARSF